MQQSPARFLATHAVFTRDELVEALTHRGSSTRTIDSTLLQWTQRGWIRRVKRGVYLRADVTLGEAHLHAIVSRMAPDAALAYHTALEWHGLAHSLYERLTFATWTKVKATTFEGREIVPVRPPAGLASNPLGWTETVRRGELEVRTTTIERTLIDVLDRPDLAGGLPEVWAAFDVTGGVAIDPAEVLAYVRCIGKRALAATVGVVLEALHGSLVVGDGVLHELERMRPRVSVYWDRSLESRKVARWNLMVPIELLDQEES